MSREGNQIKEAGRFTKSPAPELMNSAFTMEVNQGRLLYHGILIIVIVLIDLVEIVLVEILQEAVIFRISIYT